MPLIPTKLLALAPAAILLSAAPAASASPSATRVVHEGVHTRTASATAPRTTPAATTPMLAADGCPLPGNVGKGGDAHDRCELRRAHAIADGEVARK
jgi:hypothetical protein